MYAFLIVGQERGLSNLKNELIRKSPIETWNILNEGNIVKKHPAHFFACTDKLIISSLFKKQWIYNSSSQFERTYHCLLKVENAFPDQHRAFIKIRPDYIILSPLQEMISTHVFYGKYYYYPGYMGATTSSLTRDQVICGMCDYKCECAQRKYGQILYKFKHDDCKWPIVTDQVFAFGRGLLHKMLNVLKNYSNPSTSHFSRNSISDKHCIKAGRMVEVGFSRLLEDKLVHVKPFSMRGIIERSLRNNTPVWASSSCMLTWGNSPAPLCNQSCGTTNHFLKTHGFDTIPTLDKSNGLGCNILDRNTP
mgnify:CR=1 FL=1